MELRQLEQFVAVAEAGSFTRAAERLHVVQSGVSASVQGLERDLGARLFERGAGGVRLTPAGSALLPAARATLDAARVARDVVAEIATGIAGDVVLGTMASLGAVDLPGLLAQLRRDHPAVRVRLRTSPTGTTGLTEGLARGELDAALIANDGSGIAGIRLTRLLDVPIVALMRADHPLADPTGVSLKALAGEPFIDFPIGYGIRRAVDAAYERLGLTRSVAVEVNDTSDAAAYVRLGLGVSLVPSVAFGRPGHGVREFPLRPALPLVLWLGVSTSRTPSAAARALLDLIPSHTGRIV